MNKRFKVVRVLSVSLALVLSFSLMDQSNASIKRLDPGVDFNLSKLQYRAPAPHESKVYDQMLEDIRNSHESDSIKDALKREIQFLKIIFEQRDNLLIQTFESKLKNNADPEEVEWHATDAGVSPDQATGVLHPLASAIGVDGKGLSLAQRLNFIHNLYSKSYLQAKKEGDLAAFFHKGFRQGDSVEEKVDFLLTRYVRPIQLQIKVKGLGFVFPTESQLYDYLFESANWKAAWSGQVFDEDFLRAYLKKMVGTRYGRKVLDQHFVDQAMDYGENISEIF